MPVSAQFYDASAPPFSPSGPMAGVSHALVIDDHPLFCDALAITLRGFAGLETVQIHHRLDEAIAGLGAGERADIALLDLDLPDVEGLEGLLRLRAAAPQLKVLIVSSMDDNRVISAALAGGASGFVTKKARREAILAAVRAVAKGETYLPEGYEAEAGSESGGEALARIALLTRQQAKILELLCQGRLNKQIAWELAIAETTVKAHVTAIMRKLGVQSRTQAVLMAHEVRFDSLSAERDVQDA